MLVVDLPIPEEVKQILTLKGIKELYPPQADAVNTGVLEGKNLYSPAPRLVVRPSSRSSVPSSTS
jgi:helicase